MTKYPDLFAALASPFDPHEVKVRTQAGRQLHYITARTVMNRLDAVLGPENWWDSFRSGGDNSVLCSLTIRLPDGSTLTKEDAGGHAGMADAGDDEKSAMSDAFKRAAVKFGVGRYLYRDGVPSFASERFGEVPADPAPASPAPARRGPAPAGRGDDGPRGDGPGPGRQYDGPPRNGRGMFAWCKEQEQRHEVGLLRYLNQWAKLQEFPGRMVDWDAEQVALAYKEAVRKIASIQNGGRGEAGDDEQALTN